MNRIADVFFILGISLILLTFNTMDFILVFNTIYLHKEDVIIFFNQSFNVIFLISLFLLIGAVGKSAQIGLHT